jgi:elongation factor Ts
MATVTTADIKALREATGAGIMDCKRALDEADGDHAAAKKLLDEQGLAKAAKRTDRAASQGLVHSYIHGDGRVGVLVEVNCETDFVARTDEFQHLVHEIALHIAGMSPEFVSEDELPEDYEGNSEETVLLSQPFVRDPSLTVEDLVKQTIVKTGENVVVRRFSRYERGL